MAPAYIPGLQLAREFYAAVVRPLLEEHFPRLPPIRREVVGLAPLLIRREADEDVSVIRAITAAAFARPGEDPPEARLVDELRASPAWLPELSLVAATPAGEILGHVLCTRGHVGRSPVLALGPLTVRPDSQGRGVGSALMHAILGAADALGEPWSRCWATPPTTAGSDSSSPRSTRSRRPGRNGSRTSRSAS